MKKIKNYWIDENRNIWNDKNYCSDEAQKISKTMINCFDCVDCDECRYCNDCNSCDHTIDCDHCKHCKHCSTANHIKNKRSYFGGNIK